MEVGEHLDAIVGSRLTSHVRNRTTSRRCLQRAPVMVEEDHELALAVVSGVMSSAQASDAEEREKMRERKRDRKIFLRVWLRLVSGFDSSRWSYNLQPSCFGLSASLSPTCGFAPFSPSPVPSFLASRSRVALPSASLTYDRARKQTLVPKPASITA